MRYVIHQEIDGDGELWGHVELPSTPTKKQMLQAVARAVEEMEEWEHGEVTLAGLFDEGPRDVLTLGRFNGKTYPPAWTREGR